MEKPCRCFSCQMAWILGHVNIVNSVKCLEKRYLKLKVLRFHQQLVVHLYSFPLWGGKLQCCAVIESYAIGSIRSLCRWRLSTPPRAAGCHRFLRCSILDCHSRSIASNCKPPHTCDKQSYYCHYSTPSWPISWSTAMRISADSMITGGLAQAW